MYCRPLRALSWITSTNSQSKICANVPFYRTSSKFLSFTPVKYSIKQEKEKMRIYAVKQYMKYLDNYKRLFEQKFPAATSMYRLFSDGMIEFFKDLKTYIKLKIKIFKDQGFTNICREEIELYYKMPKDILKVTPVLLLSVIPFGNYLIFPLAYLLPRKILCSHFWSIQQRGDFLLMDLQERLIYNKPIFRALQLRTYCHGDDTVNRKWANIIALLGSGSHPKPKDLIACKDLFSNQPYSLDYISYSHAGDLLKVHGIRKGAFRKNRLSHHAFILQQMDKAIIREGGVKQMSTESLIHACHIRGLNSRKLSRNDMILWLEQWLEVSEIIDESSASLLLHCPIFLAYNHPQNWMLIYC